MVAPGGDDGVGPSQTVGHDVSGGDHAEADYRAGSVPHDSEGELAALPPGGEDGTEQLPAKKSPLSVLLFYRLDGAYSQVPEDATAFSGGRSPRYAVFIIGICPVPELLEAERAWVRSFWEALRPHSIDIGSYVNALSDVDEDRLRASYGPKKYERLAAIKRTYDPDNVFHRNATIKPA